MLYLSNHKLESPWRLWGQRGWERGAFRFVRLHAYVWASLIAQLVKSPPAMQETLVKFLGREDLLEKGKATHSCILELPWWLSWQRTHLQCGRPGLGRPLGEEKGYPLEYSGFGEFHGLHSPGGHRELDTSERLSLLRSLMYCLSCPGRWRAGWATLSIIWIYSCEHPSEWLECSVPLVLVPLSV